MGRKSSFLTKLFAQGADEPDPAEEGFILNSITFNLAKLIFAPSLPAVFSYCNLDPRNDEDFREISGLLRGHFIKSKRTDASFTLYYPDPVLRMVLYRTPPEFNVGIRFESGLLSKMQKNDVDSLLFWKVKKSLLRMLTLCSNRFPSRAEIQMLSLLIFWLFTEIFAGAGVEFGIFKSSLQFNELTGN